MISTEKARALIHPARTVIGGGPFTQIDPVRLETDVTRNRQAGFGADAGLRGNRFRSKTGQDRQTRKHHETEEHDHNAHGANRADGGAQMSRSSGQLRPHAGRYRDADCVLPASLAREA